MQEIEDELQPGVIHPAGRAQVLDAAELVEAFGIKESGLSGIAGDGSDEALLLVVEDGSGMDARQFGDDLDGVKGVGFLAIYQEISVVRRWIGVHGVVG